MTFASLSIAFVISISHCRDHGPVERRGEESVPNCFITSRPRNPHCQSIKGSDTFLGWGVMQRLSTSARIGNGALFPRCRRRRTAATTTAESQSVTRTSGLKHGRHG
ncbi:hypothetical protein QBC39DRAFT_77934 [Podospora conica]|nr:hypothetical protein QBC39DRAFT_77934 [Schizothecium conicum]